MSTTMAKLRTFRIKDLEKITGIEAWRWYEMFAQNRGPAHFRVGKTIRVTVGALEVWMRAQEQSEPEGGAA
jgi:hypothetical protein